MTEDTLKLAGMFKTLPGPQALISHGVTVYLIVAARPYRQLPTTLQATALQHLATISRRHASTEPVLTQPFEPLRLIGSLHNLVYP